MKIKTAVVLALLILPAAFAYQLHTIYDANEALPVQVTNPEELQYFFGELGGSPEYYTIISDKPFLLSLRLLVPDVPGDAKEIMSLYVSTEGRQQLFLIEPTPFEREQYYDKLSSAWYIKDAETVKQLDAGRYVAKIFNENNNGKYVLSVGQEEDPMIIEKFVWSPVLLAVKENYLGRDIILPAVHKFGILIIIASLAALYVSALTSRKSKDINKAVVEAFFILRYAVWIGILVFFATGILLYQKHVNNVLLLSELALGLVLVIFWAWVSTMDIGNKFSKIRDKKVLITEKYNKTLSNRLIVSIALWVVVLLMASVF